MKFCCAFAVLRGFSSNERLAMMVCLLTAVVLFQANASGQAAVTSPPPSQIVFVPLSNALELTKHPTLPVLYVACAKMAESKDLVTFRLNPNGTVVADSMKGFGDYFGVDVKKPELAYRLLRPTVAAELNILYLGITPDNVPPAQLFAATNHNELAAVALDEQGQPKRLLRAFRTDATKTDTLMNIRYAPASRRLFLIYWTDFGWCNLDKDGLPVSHTLNIIPSVNYSLDWDCAADGQRVYARSYAIPYMTVSKLRADGSEVDLIQPVAIDSTSPRVTISASMKFQKIYISTVSPGEQLTILSVTEKGRITGLPRRFSLSENAFTRFDWKADLVYAFSSTGILNLYKLNTDGYPVGQPATYQLACGEVRDAMIDETTGKVYVACSQPPVDDGMNSRATNP